MGLRSGDVFAGVFEGVEEVCSFCSKKVPAGALRCPLCKKKFRSKLEQGSKKKGKANPGIQFVKDYKRVLQKAWRLKGDKINIILLYLVFIR